MVRVIMVGDVVGEPGLGALERGLPALRDETGADFTVVNGENAADGFGMTEAVLNRILAAGADVVTSGNHVWEKREFWPVLERESRLLRPANYPAPASGRGWAAVPRGGHTYLVINLQGREQMPPLIDCPFRAFDELWQENTLCLVDFHAESTREKEALAFYLDGRASVVAGTHTHTQTSDGRMLPQGTAYITDLGMTGVIDGVLGMEPGICLDRVRTQVLYRMAVANPAPGRRAAVQGILAALDEQTGRALSIKTFSKLFQN